MCALLAVIAVGGNKSGGNTPQGLPRPPLLLQVEEPATVPSIAPVSVHTNGVAFRAESTNAVEITAFRTVGGTELGDWIEVTEPFFVIGTNPVFRCYVSASGSISFNSMRRPPVGSALPDLWVPPSERGVAQSAGGSTSYSVLCPLRAHLGMVPESNWAIAGAESRFWHDALPGGGRVLTWENALVDRQPGRRVSLQVELQPTGDCVYRYDFHDELDPPPTNFVMGAQMGTNGVNALAMLTPLAEGAPGRAGWGCLAATVWNVDGVPITNGVSVADLLCTNGDLRTPAAFEIHWKNTTGLDPDADTDGDGLTDWAEIFLWGTYPDHADTDADGIADNVELMAGADPLDADEDGDGIPDGLSPTAWAGHPLWAENSANVPTVVVSLNAAIPPSSTATLVLDNLPIPLREPASWSFGFVPGVAHEYRLLASGGTSVNLSITAAPLPQPRLNAPRNQPAGNGDGGGTPLWEKGTGGVFDGGSSGGSGKVAVADITYTWTADGDGHHFTNVGGVCLHDATRAALIPHAVPDEIESLWELTNLYGDHGMFWMDVPYPGQLYFGTARLASDILREGELSVTFGAHRCDATQQAPFCSVCGCYVPLDAELIGETRLLTLKYDNETTFSIFHRNSPGVVYANPHFEICQWGYSNWIPLSGDTWTARIAGTFEVRGTVEANGREIDVGPITLWVRFPSEEEMIDDPAIQAQASALWAQTLANCTPTNRQEFGCWILLDTSTDTYSFTTTTNGPPTPNYQTPDIELGTPPPDVPFRPSLLHGSGIYAVGSLHAHTPTTFIEDAGPRPAGPSEPDRRASRVLRMPGLVYDYAETTEGGGIPMGLPMNAAAHLYPTGEVPRRE